jgi:hypothetical protein
LKLSFLTIFIIINLSCKNTTEGKEEVLIKPNEIGLKTQIVQVKPNKQINKTIETWDKYFDKDEDLEDVREAFKKFQKNNYPISEDLPRDKKMAQLEENDKLKYSFDKKNNKFSRIGIYLDSKEKRDTIIQLDVNIELGQYSNNQNHSLWIIKEIEYSLKHKENLEIENIFDINYHFNRYLDKNDVEQFFSVGFRIWNLNGYSEVLPVYRLFYEVYMKMAKGKIEKNYLPPLGEKLNSEATSYKELFKHTFETEGIYKIEVEGDIEYWAK